MHGWRAKAGVMCHTTMRATFFPLCIYHRGNVMTTVPSGPRPVELSTARGACGSSSSNWYTMPTEECIIPNKILEQAAAFVNEGRGRGQSSEFYDPKERRCTLCNLTLDCSYSAHSNFVEHQACSGIVERAIALINTYLHYVFTNSSRAPSGQASATIGGHSASTRMGKKLSQCDANIFHGLLPSIEQARQNPDRMKGINFIDVVLRKWWRSIDRPQLSKAAVVDATSDTARVISVVNDFHRISSLSASTTRQRLWRIRYLIEYLKERAVLRDSLTLVATHPPGGKTVEGTFARSQRFERCEMVGDNIVKVVVQDRLRLLFPLEEGGVTNRLALVQQLLDSNSGLLAIYDYLRLDEIIGVRLPNSKSKADVVESLFGELQTFLWASEHRCGATSFPSFPNKDFRYVRAVVAHVLHEMTHVVIMWRLETTLYNARAFIEEKTRLKAIQEGMPRNKMREEERDRSRYAVLPLATLHKRMHPNFPHFGKDIWYYAVQHAPTHAGPQHDIVRCLSHEPLNKPSCLEAHYTLTVGIAVVENMAQYREDLNRAVHDEMMPESVAAVSAFDQKVATDSCRWDFGPTVSFGARRFESWRADEAAAESRQRILANVTASRYSASAVQDLIQGKLELCRQALWDEGASMMTRAPFQLPDFTSSPVTRMRPVGSPLPLPLAKESGLPLLVHEICNLLDTEGSHRHTCPFVKKVEPSVDFLTDASSLHAPAGKLTSPLL